MHCPHCSQSIKPAPLWMVHHSWHCSHCGGAYGINTHGKPFAIPDDFIPRVPLFSHSVARRWCFYAGNLPYVYALCYPNGLPFYVGSGIRLRAMAHCEETQQFETANYAEKHRVIDELHRANVGVWYHFFGQLESRQKAYALENYYIDLWGLRSRGGILTNDAPARGPRFDHIEYADAKPFDSGTDGKPGVVWFEHPDYIATSPDRIPGGCSSMRCLACGVVGYYYDETAWKKLLCSNCGHYFHPIHQIHKPAETAKPMFAISPKPKRPPPIRRFLKWIRRTFG